MNKRFALSAAGVSAAAIGGSVAAEVVTVRFHLDRYPTEASFYLVDGSGTIAYQTDWATGVVGNDSRYISSSYGYWSGSNASYGWYVDVTMDLSSGLYGVNMEDSYGDGWSDTQWGGYTDGSDAFSGPYGSLVAFSSGEATTGTFSVVPAPGALALLGLAGVAGIQRRRK